MVVTIAPKDTFFRNNIASSNHSSGAHPTGVTVHKIFQFGQDQNIESVIGTKITIRDEENADGGKTTFLDVHTNAEAPIPILLKEVEKVEIYI